MGKDGELRMLEEEGFSASGRHSAVRSYLCLTDQRRGGEGEPALELATAVLTLKQSKAGQESKSK